MDVLSQVTDAMRTGRPRFVRVEGHHPWRRRIRPVPGTAFHVLLQGSCRLVPPAGDPVVLGVGDVVLLPNGHGHGIADSYAAPLLDSDPALDEEFGENARTVTLGSGEPGGPAALTVLLSGVFPLDQSWCHPVVNGLPDVVHVPAQLRREPPLRVVLDLLREESEGAGMGADSVISSLLDTLLLYTLRVWYQEHGVGRGWGPALNDVAISRVLCRIHNDPGGNWTVEGLGEEAGLSRSAFARRFTELVGQPPLSYLTWLRMNMAAQRLRDSEEPLGAIAQRVGYTSEFAFAAAFKRLYGTAPGAYRRQERSVMA
ncbi:AraC family transcriptional regulator [Streptomyces sp. NPDC050164]|uniref:AraC family transcriptional regulator n=1 Tax=Streptomyces sp. NPDC050164 TaxID=3365605 RepID=UPI0037B9E7F9